MTGVLVHNRVSQSHFVRLLQQFCGLPCRNVCLTTERAVWVQALATGTLFGQSDKMLAVICDELASHFDVITWVLRLGSSTRLRIRSWLWQVLDKSYWHTCTCTHTLSMYLHVSYMNVTTAEGKKGCDCFIVSENHGDSTYIHVMCFSVRLKQWFDLI